MSKKTVRDPMWICTDYPQDGQLAFQDPANQWVYAIIDLHDRIIFYQIIQQVIVLWVLVSALQNKNHLPFLQHGNMIEQVWTQTPAAIQWALGQPSQKQQYIIDEIQGAEITIKAIGNQWYVPYAIKVSKKNKNMFKYYTNVNNKM